MLYLGLCVRVWLICRYDFSLRAKLEGEVCAKTKIRKPATNHPQPNSTPEEQICQTEAPAFMYVSIYNAGPFFSHAVLVLKASWHGHFHFHFSSIFFSYHNVTCSHKNSLCDKLDVWFVFHCHNWEFLTFFFYTIDLLFNNEKPFLWIILFVNFVCVVDFELFLFCTLTMAKREGGGDCLTQQDWEEIESSKIFGKQWLILHCNYYQIQLKKQADTNYEHYPTLLLAISQLVFTFLWNVWRIL